MKLKRLLGCYIAVLISTFLFFYSSTLVNAECPPTDYDCQIAELQKEYDARKEAHEKNKISLAEYEKEITNINKKLTSIEIKLKNLEKEITEQEVDLGFQEELLANRVRNYYIESRRFSPLLLLLSSRSAQELTRELASRQQVANQDRKIITQTSEELRKLKTDKESLKKGQVSLAALKKQTGEQVSFLREEVAKTESFFAQISAKQQELLALKAGGFQTSVGEVPPADDPASRPDFDPGFRPAFAVFSFGAPHRKGMSQFGAFGRAKAGQTAEQILKAYYGEGIEIKKDYSTAINIRVQGYGTVDLETYTKRIYEMPSSWGNEGGMEALKAQAVAARSYALAYTNNGTGSICATESCQVYKSANKGGKWEEAVNATRGWVLVANGQPFSSWYASTAGGYIFSYSAGGYTTPGLWDTSRGRDGWTDEAWEKKAGSPWFYKGWYRTRSGSTCGRSHPWLSSEELADILNAWQVLYRGGGDASRVSPVTTACWPGNPYSLSELQSFGGYTGVSSVSVVYGNDGVTQTVSFQTNKDTVSMAGEEFKRAFNLRAPGYVGIKSSLFNLVKK